MRVFVTIVLIILTFNLLVGLDSKSTYSAFSDSEVSNDNTATAWVSTPWLQTTQAHFQAGVSNNVDTTTTPDSVILSLVPNPTIITSDNNTVQTAASGASLAKTLTFTKSGASYNELRIDSNLKILDSQNAITSSIRVDDVEKFTHNTNSTTYVNYSDVLDFSSYSDGQHTVKLYLDVNGSTGYNSKFELYRTSPVLVDSNNTEVSASGDPALYPLFVLQKTITFTKSGSDYNSLRIDTNLHRTTPATAHNRIDVDDVATFTHSSTSSTYENFSDLLDFSSYADGPHTIKLYISTSNKLKAVYNSKFELWRTTPVLITSDNLEVSVGGAVTWELVKILSVTKSGATYNELRFDSNLKASSPATAWSSIRVDDVEQFQHSTTSTTYVSYSDTLNFSAYSEGVHSIKLYIKTGNQNQPAYNSVFEAYRTKTYASSGTIASQVIDTTNDVGRWDALAWSETLQSGTDITFEVRASDTIFLKDAVSPSWTAVPGNSILQTINAFGQYKQWRATLTPDSATRANTPALHDVTAYYSAG